LDVPADAVPPFFSGFFKMALRRAPVHTGGHRSSGLDVPADAVPPFFSSFFKSGATASAGTYRRTPFRHFY